MIFVNSLGNIIDKNEILAERYVFYGASTRNRAVISELDISEQVICYADSDERKWGGMLDGYEIHSIKDIKIDDDTVIISVLTDYIQDVSERIHRSGYKECYFSFPVDIKNIYEMNDQVLRNLRPFYKYIHFFNNDKFIRYFYVMLSENFDMSEHLFIVDFVGASSEMGFVSFKEIDEWNKKYHNILFFYDIESIDFIAEYNSNAFLYSGEILDVFDKSEKIWVHSAWFAWRFLQFVSGLLDRIPEKIRWICHGGEADYDKSHPIYIYIISKLLHAYSGAVPKRKLLENYGLEADLLPVNYFYLSNDLIRKICDFEKKSDITYILLGHSAEKYNNHLDVLKILERFSEQKLRVICPLAYGEYKDMEYGRQVIEKGRQIFGDKFLPITEFQNTEDYHVMLNSIDVALFPMRIRMAGNTTITFLNAIGKKIFMYDELIEKISGIQAVSIEKIKNMTFDEFVSNKQLSREEKFASLCELSKKNVNRWKSFLDS